MVKATDAAGNAGSASRSWTIAALLPDLLVSSLRNNGITIKNDGAGTSGPTIVVVSGVGTYSLPSIGPGQSVDTSTGPARQETLTATVNPSKQGH